MRIALITNDRVYRLGFHALIEASDDLTCLPDPADRPWGFEDVDRHRPDVLIIDASFLGVRAGQATREVRRRSPGTRVLLVTAWARERDAVEVVAAGGSGLALKTDGSEELVAAIRQVGRGRLYVAPAFRRFAALKQLVRTESEPRETDLEVLGALSPREREVFDLVASGASSVEASAKLRISTKTVDTHRTRIQRKLGCRDALDLIRFVADNDLLQQAPGTERTVLLLMDDDPRLRREILSAAVRGRCRVDAPLRQGPATDGGPAHASDGLAQVYGPAGAQRPDAPPAVVSALEKTGRQLAVRVAASLPSASSLTGLRTCLVSDEVASKPDMDDAVAYRTLPGGHEHDQSRNHPGGR